MTHLADLAPLLTALGFLINAVVGALSWFQSRQNAKKIETIHKATNSLTAKLVQTTGDERFAAGLKQGEDNPR